VILVDTLRADHVGSYGHHRETSPAIDALARDAVRFARAYASAPWTKPSVASMLTGLHPSAHTVLQLERSLPQSARTLAERLGEAGYATGAVISHHVIGSEYGFDQGFDHFVEDQGQGHMHVSTPRVTEQATALLDTLAAQRAPFFLLIHYFDPHFLYLRHPEYGFAGERPERIRWKAGISGLRRLDPPATEEEIAYLEAAYD
jgi:arylsulfatase